MKAKKLLVIPVLLLALMAFGAFTVPQAHAATVSSHSSQGGPLINRDDCAGRGDLFQVYNNTGELCFANEGVQSVYIDQIYETCAGSNRGYWLDGSGNPQYFNPWTCDLVNNAVMTQIHIY